jgi:hypothetical protein
MAEEKPYVVRVDENSHYMDASESYTEGGFDDCASAVAACKRMVDEFLAGNSGGTTNPEELFRIYTIFGEDPYVISNDPGCTFSAWDYARERCRAIFEAQA